MVEVEVIRISYNNPERGYAITLKDLNSDRFLPIIVGSTEAQAIALAFEGVEMPRPLTHDLLASVIHTLDTDVSKVLITHLSNGTYYAKVVLENEQQGELKIDSRPSDAIALGLRLHAPILVSETILNYAGVPEPDSTDKAESPNQGNAKDVVIDETLKNLNTVLQVAIEEENYEVAAKIRDRISFLENE